MNTRVFDAKTISKYGINAFNERLKEAIESFNDKYRDEKNVTISLSNFRTAGTGSYIVYSVIVIAIRVPDLGDIS